jgi:ribonuclease P protein component
LRLEFPVAETRNREAVLAAVARGGAFPKTARLLRHADFERVYRDGRRVFSANMTLFWLRRDDAAGPRVGFTVGRVLGGAVVRNRIRRRMREAVRLQLAPLAQPVDIVINPRKSALDAAFEQLLAEVAEGFRAVAAGRGAAAQPHARGRARRQPQPKTKATP